MQGGRAEAVKYLSSSIEGERERGSEREAADKPLCSTFFFLWARLYYNHRLCTLLVLKARCRIIKFSFFLKKKKKKMYTAGV
jgi:hypothetical protein